MGYVKRHEYTEQRLANDYIRDLVVDIRCAERDNLLDYANDCRQKLFATWRKRHNPVIDRWGMPA